MVIHGPAAGVISLPLPGGGGGACQRSTTAAHRPQSIIRNGEHALNAAAILHLAHDSFATESGSPRVAAAAARFRERVAAEQLRTPGATLDDVIARVGNLPRLEDLMARGTFTADALVALLNGDALN